MRWVLVAELGLTVVGGLAFLAAYARGRWWVTSTGRMIMAWAAVGVGEAASLLAALLGVVVPVLVFAIGFGLADVVVIWRLVELVHAQRRGARATAAPVDPDTTGPLAE
jgi:hypothetical protein